MFCSLGGFSATEVRELCAICFSKFTEIERPLAENLPGDVLEWINSLDNYWSFRQMPSRPRLSVRDVPVLPLIALMCWMMTLGVVAAIVIEGVLPHFNFRVAWDRLM
jgi:hypothetical protein